MDSLGTRMAYLEQSIREKCQENWLAKTARKIDKTKPELDCKYYEVGKYGCSTSRNYKTRRKYKRKKYKPIRRYDYIRQGIKKKYYRPKKYMRRKNYQNKKSCTCFNCGEIGHISTNCKKPRKIPGKNINNTFCYKITEEQEQVEYQLQDDDILYISDDEIFTDNEYIDTKN